ncbi:hypothetical protein EJB05_24415 [Eragrostis curvula]|uniref:IST1-like protein n=1 Tax=Eragrostis curvula TaxID=38414 RepID=A0A5J9V8U3_9POAL|nr:hypothetical protein EJB05_24415 [Eragrostis curvula]
MFDALLNSKFYNKCKHAIKCTRTRLDLLRRKKQAMVKFLKKDVADLLINGLESHAFGRMEGLIVEMNQASCYDMIELYCGFIGKQLNNMQKESECPQEALEAVSTLIFAAARFPDLPELCDLRHIFTEKYGSSIESFINQEFVQKLQNKTFTNEEKLQVMKSVAEEFSVPFDGKALEWKITCAPQQKHDLAKKGSHKRVEVEASSRNGQKVDRHAMHERKYKATPEGYEQKQETKMKPKDIRVVPDGTDQMGEKIRKNYSGKPDEKRQMDDYVPPLDVKGRNSRKEAKKHDKKDDPHRRGQMNAELDLNGIKKQEPGAVKPAGGPDHSWGQADLGLKTLGLEKQENDSTCTLNSKTANKAPPYSKPYRSVDEKLAEENHNSLYDRPKHVGDFGQQMLDRQHVAEKAVNMRPPYVKQEFEKHINQAANGYKHAGDVEIGHMRGEQPVSVRTKDAKHAHGDAYDGIANDTKLTDQTPDGRRRHSSRRNGAYDNYDHKGGRVIPVEGIGADDDINNARAFHRIPSERRKHKSRRNGSTSGSDYNGANDDHESGDDDANTAIDFGNLLPRAHSSHRKHRSRSADPRKGGRDDEERVMDKLLMHYSKKGLDREERKERDREERKERVKSRIPRPRADQPARGVREHSNKEDAPVQRPERAASLPPESASPKAKPKAPVRSMSMQPEMSRGNVHPRLPDFDELAERIRALKNA